MAYTCIKSQHTHTHTYTHTHTHTHRYNEGLELEDAIHTAILTLKVKRQGTASAVNGGHYMEWGGGWCWFSF